VDVCSICKNDYDACSLAYDNEKWIDDKCHKLICWTCFCVPKMWHYNEEKEEIIVYEEFDPKRLHTVNEMMEDGFDEKEAKHSIRAVKKLLKKGK
jgi:hypothetical protein